MEHDNTTNRKNKSQRFSLMLRERKKGIISITLAFISLFILTGATLPPVKNTIDWMTGLSREPIHVATWPQGKKVAVCFVLFVEEWGIGQGPIFRSDMVSRHPDFINESFRQY